MKKANKKLIADAKRQLQSGVRMRRRQIKKVSAGKGHKFFINIGQEKIGQYHEAIKALKKGELSAAFESVMDIRRTRRIRFYVSRELLSVCKRLGKAIGLTPMQIKIKML